VVLRHFLRYNTVKYPYSNLCELTISFCWRGPYDFTTSLRSSSRLMSTIQYLLTRLQPNNNDEYKSSAFMQAVAETQTHTSTNTQTQAICCACEVSYVACMILNLMTIQTSMKYKIDFQSRTHFAPMTLTLTR